MLLLILITTVCILLIIAGIITNESDFIGSGCLLLTMTIAFGWGIIGGLRTSKSVTTSEMAMVLHDKSSVHLSYNGQIIKTYNDVATFTYLSDKEKVPVMKKKNFNMYDGLVGVEWELPNVTQ